MEKVEVRDIELGRIIQKNLNVKKYNMLVKTFNIPNA